MNDLLTAGFSQAFGLTDCASPAMGQAIGTVANTALLETALGDHLHFSVSCDDQPMDPNRFLNLT